MFSRYSTEKEIVYVDKDPNAFSRLKYTVEKYLEHGGHLAIQLKYDECKNYEGRKILVFQDTTILDLWHQKEIDPHFTDDKAFKHPVARFIPTDEGWGMATKFLLSFRSKTTRSSELGPMEREFNRPFRPQDEDHQ
jgi:hypothetical protein